MKKVILMIVCLLPLLAFGQSIMFIDTVAVNHPVTDSVRWTDIGDVSSWPSSVTITTIGLTDTVTVDFGKSNNILSMSGGIWSKVLTAPFQGIEHDSLPYVFIASEHQVITNQDTTYEKNISFPDPWLAVLGSYKYSTHQDTTFTLIIRWLFAK